MSGKIRSDTLNTQAVLFSAYYRSLTKYLMVPLYAVEAVTEQEINDTETNIKRFQFGWRGAYH